MRYCFDIDGVIFKINKDYKKHEIIEKTKIFIQKLKAENHEIILYTARKMSTYKGNIGLVNSSIVEITLQALRVNEIIYDEIYFGKPAADIYIDDKALNFYDLESIMVMPNREEKNVNLGIISYRLNEIEKSLEKNMDVLSKKIDKLIEKHNNNEVNQNALKIKVEKLEEEVKELKLIDKAVQEDIGNVKVSIAEKMGYGVAGGSLVTLGTKLLEYFGGNS